MLSYWPHQALTSMTAGWSITTVAPATAHHGRARSAYATSKASPTSASVAGIFISTRIDWIRRVRDRLERWLERGEQAPDVGHDRREREVLVVGAPEAVDRDPVDPEDELVEVAASPSVGSRTDPDDDAGDDDDPEREELAARPAFGRGSPGSRAQTRPDAQYRSAEPATTPSSRHRSAVRADRVGHRQRAVEESLHLALVQVDADDLPLDLVGDVGELWDDADVGRQGGERVAREVLQPTEVVPPRVREILVERDDAGVIRARHHPAAALLEQSDPDLAAELVIDVAADAERQVDLLRLEPGDLLREQLERGVVVGARHPEQLVVALVAAEDRVRQVEEDDRCLGEVGEALVLDPAARHQVARPPRPP